ncbi:anaerobic ribonucleoside triphosphate reductase [Thermococcus sp. AM4]|uniref:anaerobic ribonucleoside triphosphate reductase n=1 Tax=Thermococcus sp. (strain AM4) TaxID=246969 RepID=UPI00018708B5|nr:anaerobic ribonucleoside triphosphate reductase [Thermococcus sp. AM4]EEB73363.1 anaeobic ribonucleotide-triphosphate reductase [Thermococcus sp. AM4]
METVKRDIIQEYAGWSSLDVLENANRYPGPTGFFAYVMEESLKESISLVPKEGREAHFSGDIYIHKLPYSLYIPYCTGHSTARLLEKGLKTPTIVSRPARHFDTYVDHIANYLITMQHYFSGAQALSSVEWYAGPFIRKESLDRRKIRQQIQRLVYNLNYPTRIGLQTPFTNFTVTLDAPKKMLEGDHAVYAGEKVEPLGEYEREAKEFFIALTEVLREGDALGQPFTFPIPTLMVTAKMLWDDPEVFEEVFGTASKRGSFYWLNTNVVDPDASYAMCLYENENVLYRANGDIGVAPIQELFERFAGELESREDDGAEWYGVRDTVEVLAVDPKGEKVEWKPIKRFLKKEYGKAIRVHLSDGRSFVVSPDHPIPVLVKYDNSVRLMKAEELAKRSLGGYAYRIPVVLTEIEGEKAKLQLEDGREIDVNEDFGYFMGLFYGDGTFIRSSDMARRTREEKHREGYYLSGIQFSINSAEKDVKEFLVQFSINVLGREPKVKRDPRWESLTYVRIYDAYLARALYDEGVSGLSHEKRIPGVIWRAPAKVRRAFLKGLLHSDGYWRKGAWELHIKNRELAEGVLTLSAITGISAYFRENRDGSVVVYFPGSWGEEIGRPSEAVKHRVSGNLAWVTVLEAEEIEVGGTFYDVEVEGIHYFTHSSGVVTHNCCRIAIDKTEMAFAFGVSEKSAEEEALERLERGRFGGLWAMPDVTGSVNVTTVNLPKLALKAGGDDDKFWEEYERVLEVVRRTTDWFRERYVRLITAYRHMYSMIHLYLEEFPGSHFNTVGILGLPEAASIYLNEPKLWEEGTRKDWLRAAELMKEMVEFATVKAREWMKETGTPWNVEEVPGESAAAKLAIKDLREFPELKEYLSDPENPIYSTSVAPYYGSLELADRIRVEEKIQRSFTGGVMMHIFLGEEPDPGALAKLTKRLMRTELVYWSYTPAITVCNDCNYSTTGLHTHCPRCGSKNVEIWSRIIGYYRPLKNWNPFRKKEFWTRRHYSS